MVSVEGGMPAVERQGENYYLVIPLRNLGSGLAVLQSWLLVAHRPELDAPHSDPVRHRGHGPRSPRGHKHDRQLPDSGTVCDI
jgi:hypothetical protein